MAISIYWDTDIGQHIILHMDFHGTWGWTDYDAAVNQADSLIRSVGQPVDVICNLLGGQRVPFDYIYSHLRRMTQLLGENAGLMVIVSSDKTFRAFVYVFCRTGFAGNIRITDSVQEAYELLAERQL